MAKNQALTNPEIVLFGSTGLIGSAIVRRLEADRLSFAAPSRQELDLFSLESVSNFIGSARPRIVINAAGRVGGIEENIAKPAELMLENLMIQTNVLQQCIRHDVKNLVTFGSSCMYPANAVQPYNEKDLLSGTPEPTSLPYAVAKLAGVVSCSAASKQFQNQNFVTLIPNNVYGINDNFSANSGHVIPSLIKRLHEAHERNDKVFSLWGSGKPLREFLYADDLADALVEILKNVTHLDNRILNIGSGEVVTIAELGTIIANRVGFKGVLCFDDSRPDGAASKVMDSSKIEKYGWFAKTKLKVGIDRTYSWYLSNTGA